jgi:anti-sigma factor RsiW
MDNIIRLHGDPHKETLSLLPWYVTGQLEAAEKAQVEAHLATCAQCQAELKFERRLEVEVVTAPVDVERAWASMTRRMERPRRGALAIAARQVAVVGHGAAVAARSPWLGWAMAASVALVAVTVARPPQQPAAYHTLSAAPAAAPGNVVVIFKPDTTEAAMRQTLKDAGARLVDGPTAADAYVLSVPAAQRAGALAKMRARGEVVLAEPVDAGERP